MFLFVYYYFFLSWIFRNPQRARGGPRIAADIDRWETLRTVPQRPRGREPLVEIADIITIKRRTPRNLIWTTGVFESPSERRDVREWNVRKRFSTVSRWENVRVIRKRRSKFDRTARGWVVLHYVSTRNRHPAKRRPFGLFSHANAGRTTTAGGETYSVQGSSEQWILLKKKKHATRIITSHHTARRASRRDFVEFMSRHS